MLLSLHLPTSRVVARCVRQTYFSNPQAAGSVQRGWNLRKLSSPSSRNPKIIPVFTKEGVPPIGPYSQAVRAQGLVWVSGQIPANSQAEILVGSVAEQTHRMCKNAKLVLEAAGSSLDKVVKVNIFFTNLDDFAEMNEVYHKYFPHKPARSSLEARRLPAGVAMEMDLVALE